MANTIVVVSTNEKWVSYAKLIQPFCVHINKDVLEPTPEIVREAGHRVMTKHFYLYTGGKFTKEFDVAFEPNHYTKDLPHTWNGDTRLMLFNVNSIKDLGDNPLQDHIKRGICHDNKFLEDEYIPCYREDEEPKEEFYYRLRSGYCVEGNKKMLPVRQRNKKHLTNNNDEYIQLPTVRNDTGHIIGRGGLTLHRKRNTDVVASTYSSHHVVCRFKPFDIFFMSYNEPYADEHYHLVKKRYDRVQHVKGVKGIPEAHIECAKRSTTPFFFVLDADCVLIDSFDLDDKYPIDDLNVYVWRAKNPLNNLLIYGYGGVKLMSKRILDIYDPNKKYVDFATTIADGKFKSMPNISNITAFNYDEFHTWKAAFRETVKLTLNVIKDPSDHSSRKRLMYWRKIEEKDAIHKAGKRGTEEGHQYAIKHQDDIDAIRKINDINWLKNTYSGS